MKTHTQGFKENLTKFGREFNDILTIDNSSFDIGNVISINQSYEGSLLKSVMKTLKIDSKVLIAKGSVVNWQLGLKVGNSYEYLNMGNYIVNKVEKQEDKNSYLITCYDKMLLSMIDYEDMGLTFPISIRDYLDEICDYLGITFGSSNDTFINYDQLLNVDLYLDNNKNKIGYTFRDVLDDIAQVTGSIICINSNDQLEVRYINNTNDTINGKYFKDVNVNMGEKFGPINSLVFSRTGEDNIYRKDDESIEENGLYEIKITENQILNDNDRDNYIDSLWNYLKETEYYLNDYESYGILYYEVGDMYNISIGNNTYSCIMLNDEINRTNGLGETIYTEKPDTSETDYKKADKTDKKINQTSLIVDKQNQTITSLVSTTETISGNLETTTNLALETNSKADNINTDLQQYKQTISTQFIQTNEDFTFQFDNITDLVNQVSNTESGHYNELHNYIRFVNGVIILGQEGNEMTAELSNNKLSFKQNGTEIAYVSNNKLYITNAEILENMVIGDFQFIPRNNGSLSFRKVN